MTLALASLLGVLAPSVTLVVAALYVPQVLRRRAFDLPGYSGPVLLLGAVLWLAPAVMGSLGSGDFRPLLSDMAQVLAVIALVLAFRFLSLHLLAPGRAQMLTLGVAGGCVSIALVSLGQVMFAGNGADRVSGWLSHPNFWAVQVLVPALGLLVLPAGLATRVLGGAAALFVVVASGSRTVLLAFLIGFFVILLHRLAGRFRSKSALLTAGLGLAVLLASVTLLHPRVTPVIEDLWSITTAASGPTSGSKNLLPGIWQRKMVEVTQKDDATGLIVIQKTAAEGWSRLQHQVILFPHQTYSMSGEMMSEDARAVIGILGTAGGDRADLNVWRQGETWRIETSPSMSPRDFRHFNTEDGWTRLELTFTYSGEDPARWWVGPTPDQRPLDSGAVVRVRGLQIELGPEVTPFERDESLHLASTRALSRLMAFRVAWDGFRQRPVLGWGPATYEAFFRANPPSQSVAVMNHAHNLFLQALFERGVLGGLGIVVLLVALGMVGGSGSRLFPFIVLSVVTANLFDYTFWTPGVVYTLSALAGLLSRLEPLGADGWMRLSTLPAPSFPRFADDAVGGSSPAEPPPP